MLRALLHPFVMRIIWEWIMASNEHPDMSGNSADEPIICDYCGGPCREDELYGSAFDDDKSFCSKECAGEYDSNCDAPT
jgi:hypothetical protein